MKRTLITTGFDGTHSYTYDAENHILTVDGGSTASYVYDAEGRRAEKLTGSTGVQYWYDTAGHVRVEWSLANTWNNDYVYLGGELVLEYAGPRFHHYDHLGTTRAVTDGNGNEEDWQDYLPFGEQIEGGTSTTHKFTGFERDGETNLDYAKARFLGSSMGRFLSPDPHNAGASATSPQSWNAYVYVANNPLTLTDPTGMIAQDADESAGGQAMPGDSSEPTGVYGVPQENESVVQENAPQQEEAAEGATVQLESSKSAAVASGTTVVGPTNEEIDAAVKPLIESVFEDAGALLTGAARAAGAAAGMLAELLLAPATDNNDKLMEDYNAKKKEHTKDPSPSKWEKHSKKRPGRSTTKDRKKKDWKPRTPPRPQDMPPNQD